MHNLITAGVRDHPHVCHSHATRENVQYFRQPTSYPTEGILKQRGAANPAKPLNHIEFNHVDYGRTVDYYRDSPSSEPTQTSYLCVNTFLRIDSSLISQPHILP